MRTILPFVSDPLHLQMAAAVSAGPQEHLATPDHPQGMSPPASPGQNQQPDVNLLIPNPTTVHSSANPGDVQATSAEQLQAVRAILEAATKQAPPSWNPLAPAQSDNMNAVAGPSTVAQPSGTKRKLDDTDADNPHSKIRRVVRDHITHDPGRVMPMTTVICLHAAVAQKSYGTEKRFLCPPPVVHIEGPVWNMKSQTMAMAVVTESGERSFEQKAPLDHNLNASFKFLHVSGTAKTKSFQLTLDIAEPPTPTTDSSESSGSGRVWASFDSAPVTIISKPSKKTAKTRSISSCILAGGPVSLFNRINSQTVRTKYMTVDQGQICASNISWSAFNVSVLYRPPPPANDPPAGGSVPQTVLYGSKIVLTDTVTGTSTTDLFIRKVDKGRIVNDDNGPVSQMQKIALQKVNPDGTRHYLSAAGPMPGNPGVVGPPAPGLANQAGTHPLVFQPPRVREEVKDGQTIVIDEVDDYLCWTIVGISKFQYTFFDAFGLNSRVPDLPITPFPTLFTAPLFREGNPRRVDALELTAANFFYEHPITRTLEPLDVYLGPLGPLPIRVYQAAPLGNISLMHAMRPPFIPSRNPEGMLKFVPTAGTFENYPHVQSPVHGPLHTVVMVEMPSKEDLLKALEEDALGPDVPDAAAGRVRSQAERISGRSLPLLFIRAYDGIGYHTGRAITCEYAFKDIEVRPIETGEGDGNWISEHAAQVVENSLSNWTIRVI